MSDSLFADASSRLQQATQYVAISEDTLISLKYPKASLQVSIPVRLDDRTLRIFRGYIDAIADFIGPDVDILAPDVYFEWV